MQVFRHMDAAPGVRADLLAYNAIMTAHARGGHWCAAELACLLSSRFGVLIILSQLQLCTKQRCSNYPASSGLQRGGALAATFGYCHCHRGMWPRSSGRAGATHEKGWG